MPQARLETSCIQSTNIAILPSSFSSETLQRLGLGDTLRSNQTDMIALHHQIAAGIEQCARDLDDKILRAHPIHQPSLQKLSAALAELNTIADRFLEIVRHGEERPSSENI